MEDQKESEISIDLLPNGDIRFSRFDPETNEFLIELLSELTDPVNVKEAKRFLDGAKNIEHIFGDEPLCG